MKPPPFRYHDPRTVEDTLTLLADTDEVKVLAGGQSLMPMLNMRLAYPEHLVDINRVEGLAGTAFHEQEHVLRIGATTSQHAVERDALITGRFPLLREALGHVGHFQTRNRGTIGGSLAHLDATAELVAVACAAEATIHAESLRGRRRIPISEFVRGRFTSDLATDELLVAVDLPLWAAGHGYAFEEFARRPGDFAIVATAVLLELDRAGSRDRPVITRCRIALVGLGALPVRAREAEQQLEGTQCEDAVLCRAARTARDLPASGDTAAPAGYRTALAETLVRRGLRKAVRRTGPWPAGALRVSEEVRGA